METRTFQVQVYIDKNFFIGYERTKHLLKFNETFAEINYEKNHIYFAWITLKE